MPLIGFALTNLFEYRFDLKFTFPRTVGQKVQQILVRRWILSVVIIRRVDNAATNQLIPDSVGECSRKRLAIRDIQRTVRHETCQFSESNRSKIGDDYFHSELPGRRRERWPSVRVVQFASSQKSDSCGGSHPGSSDQTDDRGIERIPTEPQETNDKHQSPAVPRCRTR